MIAVLNHSWLHAGAYTICHTGVATVEWIIYHLFGKMFDIVTCSKGTAG